MQRVRKMSGVLALIGLFGLTGCGGSKPAASDAGSSAAPVAAAPAAGDLTAFEMENGLGPIKAPVTVGPINHEMAEDGKKLFEAKCTVCHKLDQRYVGPSLGGVTQRRTPTYVMNMVLSPEENYTRHPVAKGLLGEFMTQMPNLALTPEQARAVLEYFREVDAKGAGH